MTACLLYAVFCVGLAYLNATLIRKGVKISHAYNGAIHITAAVLCWYFLGWKVGVAILLTARLVFDTALNLMRGLPLAYVPLKPASKVDQFEKWISAGHIMAAKIVYLILIICLLTIKF